MTQQIPAAPPSPVILWGAAGHARVLRDVLTAQGFGIAAVFDNRPVAPPWPGVRLHVGRDGFADWRRQWTGPLPHFALAIGGFAAGRIELANWLSHEGLPLLTIRHERAIVEPSAEISRGAQILAGAVVGASACIGALSIVNTRASVDHDTRVGTACHIAPGATICGEAIIGDRTMIAAGAVVLPRLRIGNDVMVGAGAVVTRDIPSGTVVTGIPARAR